MIPLKREKTGITVPFACGVFDIIEDTTFIMRRTSAPAEGSILNCTLANPPSFSIADSATDVGAYTSLAIGTNGLPVVSYFDDTNFDLKVLHCGNISCSSHSATTVDSAGNVGVWTSIAIGADTFPVVSYLDNTNNHLKSVHCGSIVCKSTFP